jgi:hypothetical protein
MLIVIDDSDKSNSKGTYPKKVIVDSHISNSKAIKHFSR